MSARGKLAKNSRPRRTSSAERRAAGNRAGSPRAEPDSLWLTFPRLRVSAQAACQRWTQARGCATSAAGIGQNRCRRNRVPLRARWPARPGARRMSDCRRCPRAKAALAGSKGGAAPDARSSRTADRARKPKDRERPREAAGAGTGPGRVVSLRNASSTAHGKPTADWHPATSIPATASPCGYNGASSLTA